MFVEILAARAGSKSAKISSFRGAVERPKIRNPYLSPAT